MKCCKICGITKEYNQYYKGKNKDGLMNMCIDCHKQYYKNFRKEKSGYEIERKIKWRLENPERYKKHYTEYNKIYYKNKIENDPDYSKKMYLKYNKGKV